ncbi:hypothetical protein AC629_19625 [Bradyrhizobium sp. NAS80.1]|nr:hypothetical protein AC629_19625 [Bradyrhizobium sp. NAS80.1]
MEKRRFHRRFFCCRLAWLCFVAVDRRLVRGRRGFLRRLVIDSILCFRLGRDLARWRLLGPFHGQKRGDLRQRIPDVPLADPVVVAPLRQIEMDMVLVIPVRAGTEHGGEARADRMQHPLAHVAGHGAVGQADRLPVGELDGPDVDGVGLAVLGQQGANNAVATAALEGIEIVEIADGRAEARGQRHHVLAHPVRDGGRHGAAKDRRRLDRHLALVRQHDGFEPHQILATAATGAADIGDRGRDCDIVGQREPAGRGLFLGRRCSLSRLSGARLVRRRLVGGWLAAGLRRELDRCFGGLLGAWFRYGDFG